MTLELALSLLFFLLSLFLGWRYLHLKGKLNEIRDFAGEVARGNVKKRLIEEGAREEAPLIATLNELARKFDEQNSEVEESRTRLKTTLKSLPDGVVLLDELGYVRLVNPAFERFFSLSRENLVNKRLLEAIAIPELSDLMESIEREEGNKAEVFLENVGMHVEFKVSRIRMEKVRNIGTIIIARDITSQKMAYETRREFVANVSHELKTPITAIRGSAETLLDGAIKDEGAATNFLNVIANQTRRMELLIKDLITLSKIELGAIPMERNFVAPAQVVDEVFADFREKAEKKGLYLKKEVQDEFFHIEADSNRLYQILANLVGNAINYTVEGGVTVSIAKEKGSWGIVVEDTGCGVPKKLISRLGERFFRVDPSRSREVGGTGLGLAIVKHLVKSHNWKMHIESEEGKGTRITVSPTIP